VTSFSLDGQPAKAKVSVGRYDGDTGAEAFRPNMVTLPL
jgi:hypothetical protein